MQHTDATLFLRAKIMRTNRCQWSWYCILNASILRICHFYYYWSERMCECVTFVHSLIRPFIEWIWHKNENKKIAIEIPLKCDACSLTLTRTFYLSRCVLMELNQYLMCVCGPVLVHGISRIPLSNPIQSNSVHSNWIELTHSHKTASLFVVQSVNVAAPHTIRVNFEWNIWFG